MDFHYTEASLWASQILVSDSTYLSNWIKLKSFNWPPLRDCHYKQSLSSYCFFVFLLWQSLLRFRSDKQVKLAKASSIKPKRGDRSVPMIGGSSQPFQTGRTTKGISCSSSCWYLDHVWQVSCRSSNDDKSEEDAHSPEDERLASLLRIELSYLWVLYCRFYSIVLLCTDL